MSKGLSEKIYYFLAGVTNAGNRTGEKIWLGFEKYYSICLVCIKITLKLQYKIEFSGKTEYCHQGRLLRKFN